MGRLTLHRHGVVEDGEFAYGQRYRMRDDAVAMNPATMPLGTTTMRLPPRPLRDGGALNATLEDAMPDAWGQRVLRDQHEGRALSAAQMLLATNAERVGALVFSTTVDMPEPVVPPAAASTSLDALAEATRRLDYGMEVSPAMKRLLHGGGSLGGARPKAPLMLNNLEWIAKFPAQGDDIDVPLVEAGTLTLAAECGIRVPEHRLERIGHIHALLVRRFDRPGDGRRTHYLSAAAITDSPYGTDQGSYVALVEQLRLHGAQVANDLAELYRRLVFNILIDNSDDHVKNHGVLHVGQNRYCLAPAFDLVPQRTHLGYTGMNINDGENHAHLDAVRAVAPHFGLSAAKAADCIAAIRTTIHTRHAAIFSQWGAKADLLRRITLCFEKQWLQVST
jgi:serine/threonine-protein kinase HipA